MDVAAIADDRAKNVAAIAVGGALTATDRLYILV